ncbi:hypothetical protein [Thalassospira sp. TSL5-1]|uniref:hypothetical protein n=1 Tax=Thalassospira sp. TSL5-1 TaxID=1544451 RepID=UPI00093C60B7|nr:hypothetical protein [Thalassospira sp. TSL5-1]OKH90206.1 hypothetical protein LF95_10090 [Thalassospira sp. TSL5-1]
MKNERILACFGLLFAMFLPITVQAADGCTKAPNYKQEGGLAGWPNRVVNSENKALRDGFAAGTCLYLKGQHSSGATPPGAPNNQHVTVTPRNGGVACHVFKKSSLNTSQYFPTTCF